MDLRSHELPKCLWHFAYKHVYGLASLWGLRVWYSEACRCVCAGRAQEIRFSQLEFQPKTALLPFGDRTTRTCAHTQHPPQCAVRKGLGNCVRTLGLCRLILSCLSHFICIGYHGYLVRVGLRIQENALFALTPLSFVAGGKTLVLGGIQVHAPKRSTRGSSTSKFARSEKKCGEAVSWFFAVFFPKQPKPVVSGISLFNMGRFQSIFCVVCSGTST